MRITEHGVLKSEARRATVPTRVSKMLASSRIELAIKLITPSFPCATDPGVSPNTRSHPVSHVTKITTRALRVVARAGVAY